MKLLTAAACALGAATMGLVPVFAQEETRLTYEEEGRQIYLPGFFERYAPQTARDMLNNVPGFQIRRAETKRGLGQGGTNVLINGARVSGKSTDPLDVLGRTSKDAVVRVEIVDGASLGISGLSGPVANVILDTSQRTGNFEWRPQFRKGLAARLTNVEASVSGEARGVSYTLGFENDAFRNGAWGTEFVTGPNGELLETRYETVQPYGENPKISLTLGHTDDQGREANFNGSFALFEFDGHKSSDRAPISPSEPNSLFTFADTESEWNTELSGDYAFDAFGGRLKLIAFQYFEHSDFENNVHSVDDNGFLGADRFAFVIDEGESILRAEQSWAIAEGRSFELAFEGAYNFNDRESALFDVAENGSETPVAIPGANTKVEERRGEISGTYNFPLGDRLDLQASLAAEYSELEQSGDVGNKRTFTRPKGYVSATYELTPTLELRARVEREVGQLDLFAFASSVDLDNGNDSNGNADLVPQQSWNYEVALQKTFADESQITVEIQYEDIEDSVQRVPIGDGDGVGNVPEATRWSMEITGTQYLDRFGIKGGQLEYEIFTQDSEIADPFSDRLRRLNGEQKWFYLAEFRHDIPNTNWAYGARIEDFAQALQYRRTSIGSGDNKRPGLQAFLYDHSRPTTELYVEHKDVFGYNVTAYVFNLLDYTEDLQREVFDGNSPDDPLVFKEFLARDFDPIFGLNISKTF